MSIKSEFASITHVELVDGDCGYPGAEHLDEGHIALVAGDGGVNLYLEGTPERVHHTLLRLAAQAATYLTAAEQEGKGT